MFIWSITLYQTYVFFINKNSVVNLYLPTLFIIQPKEIAAFNHNITLTERKNLVVTGVKKIDNFDSNEFLIETTMGYLKVKGSDLEIIKLDTYQGNVSIKGQISSLIYSDNDKKSKEESFISKIFK